MHLLPSSEQTEIIDSSSAFLAAHMSVTRTRELFEAGTTPAVSDEAWAAAANLGWFALGLPEERNGIGCGLADEMLLFREIGRVIAPGPFLSTVLGARVAAFGGDQALADEIIAGRRVGLVIPSSLDAIAADGSVVGDVQLVDADVASDGGFVLVATPTVRCRVSTRRHACIGPVRRARRLGLRLQHRSMPSSSAAMCWLRRCLRASQNGRATLRRSTRRTGCSSTNPSA
jgi:Acyl-CoA dehydrogenase, N-terminal domain